MWMSLWISQSDSGTQKQRLQKFFNTFKLACILETGNKSLTTLFGSFCLFVFVVVWDFNLLLLFSF